jgi:hypothetical protein
MTNPTRVIPSDPVLAGYLESADAEVAFINAESPIVSLERAPDHAGMPYRYQGTLTEVEHFVREADGTYRKTLDPLDFAIEIEHDFCRSTDPLLQFRVLRTSPLLVQPNVFRGVCCLGGRFRPATPLRTIVEVFYRLVAGRLAATADPLDPEAASYFLNHLDEVRALRAAPLWRRPTAREVRVVEAPASSAPADTRAETSRESGAGTLS